jgi:hypothetical protein
MVTSHLHFPGSGLALPGTPIPKSYDFHRMYEYFYRVFVHFLFDKTYL